MLKEVMSKWNYLQRLIIAHLKIFIPLPPVIWEPETFLRGIATGTGN